MTAPALPPNTDANSTSGGSGTPTSTFAIPSLPTRLAGLEALAMNLAWSWNRDARMLFRDIDEPLWHSLRHNPLLLLRRVEPARLVQLAADEAFCFRYDRVMQWLSDEKSDEHTWYVRTYPELRGKPIAYFCAEFGIHNSVPIYSGGLGVLAGDHLKTASDLGVPIVAVGILYRNGYFDQHIRADGWQEDSDNRFELSTSPLTPVMGVDGQRHLVTVRTFGRDVHIRVWRMMVGRVAVYLLDSDIEENHADDRPLLSKLYAGGPALRLRQEWLLGVGGVRALRALGIEPSAWHANEGHAAFMMVERVRELCVNGTTYTDAVKEVRNHSVFTTHTPVPAGHDMFSNEQVAQCTGPVWDDMGLTPQEFVKIGYHPSAGPDQFHMTAASIHLARRVNAVSRRHGIVSRELCQPLW
ncbi:MAG: alpha-glucan family phosphorylase, partial [Gemmatimonadaceae bacterium]